MLLAAALVVLRVELSELRTCQDALPAFWRLKLIYKMEGEGGLPENSGDFLELEDA